PRLGQARKRERQENRPRLLARAAGERLAVGVDAVAALDPTEKKRIGFGARGRFERGAVDLDADPVLGALYARDMIEVPRVGAARDTLPERRIIRAVGGRVERAPLLARDRHIGPGGVPF